MRGNDETNNRQRWLYIGLILLILAVALFLRLRLIDTTGIGMDQSFTLNTAMRWVNGGDIPLASNKSSVGVMNPPMIEYVYAIALQLWADVLSVALLTLLAGLAALFFTGYATYRVFSWRAALWATLLFALNPWSVLYSQLIWNQTMIPVFASLTLAALLLYFAVEQKGIYLVLVFIGAACLTQVHPGSVMQLLTIGLIMVVFWRRLRLRPLLIGIAAFVLLYVPFLLYEIGVGWTDVSATLSFAGQESITSRAAVLLTLDLLHAKGLLGAVDGLRLFDTLATLLFGLSLLYALVAGGRAFRQRHDEAQANRQATAIFILLLWLIMPVLFYLRTSAYLQVYYVMGQWPAPFILMGLALAGAQGWLEGLSQGRLGRFASWAIVALPVVALLAWQVTVNLRVQDARLDTPPEGVQIRHVRQVIDRAETLIAERPACSFVVLSDGNQVEHSELSLLREFTSIEHLLLADGDLAVPVPAPCALYLDARPGSRASAWLAQTALPLPQADVQVYDETWRFYDLPAGERADLVQVMETTGAPVTWTNGLALVGYARGDLGPEMPLPLTLAWAVVDEPPAEHYHFGAYLLTQDNQLVSQSDGPGFDSVQWRPGDHFVTWFDIPGQSDLPAGTYRIGLAMYTWPDVLRVDLAAGDNTAFVEQIEVQP
jgi:4-amino-4-deoxy-L-arabinose transferase-like glycosyltransferase